MSFNFGITGRRWRRPARTCPEWCAQDHRCTARHGYPSGQHRSGPLTWRTWYGRLVATRVEEISGEGRLEIRAVARLSDDEQVAHAEAQQLAVRIDEAIRDVLGRPPQAAAHIRRTEHQEIAGDAGQPVVVVLDGEFVPARPRHGAGPGIEP